METAIKFPDAFLLARDVVSQLPWSCQGMSTSWDRRTVITLNGLGWMLGTQVATAQQPPAALAHGTQQQGALLTKQSIPFFSKRWPIFSSNGYSLVNKKQSCFFFFLYTPHSPTNSQSCEKVFLKMLFPWVTICQSSPHPGASPRRGGQVLLQAVEQEPGSGHDRAIAFLPSWSQEDRACLHASLPQSP